MKQLLVIIVTVMLASLSSMAQTATEQNLEIGIELFQKGDFSQARERFYTVENNLEGNSDEENLFITRWLIINCSSAINDFCSIRETFIKIMAMNNAEQFLNTPYGVQILCNAANAFDEVNEPTYSDRIAILSKGLLSSESLDASSKHQLLASLISSYGNRHQISEVLGLWTGYGHLVSDVLTATDSNTQESITVEKNTINMNTIYMSVGRAYIEEKQYNNAINAYLKALEYINAHIQHNKSLIYQLLAKCYSEIGDKKNALYYQGKAIENL